MKKIMLLFSAVLLLSCGSDDASSSGKVLKQAVMASEDPMFDNVYNFTYDDKNRLSQIIRDGAQDYVTTFSYDGNAKKPFMVKLTGDVELEVRFTYDSKNKLAAAITEANTVVATHDGTGFTLNAIAGSLTRDGDLGNFSTLGLQYESKPGPFAYVKGVDTLILVLVEGNMPFFASKKALRSLSDSANANSTRSAAHTYGKNGLPETTVITGASNFTIDFTYE